ncbi:anti-sigma factor [Paractinoplanes atraurantiacus]|uniref:Anti-sigma-K factor rskA n=1 Tax=Paractinoplanes atraurantiacus TaxID=1036182 RepID=A0A285IZX9_9ACTN|nr:anti-sigma factor [Actinoplanes atraurantiacus]SNY53518.1 Anti-sigma-K factor rskA [Actinoplanes atraurantiacus]
MQHLDPDRLVLLALSEELEELNEADHLTQCDVCRHEMQALRHVAELGSAGQELRDLPPPPEHVWQAIEAGIARSAEPALPAAAPVVDLEAARARSRRSRPRWLTPVLAAAAAAVLAVAGVIAVDRLTGRAPAEQVTARATLEPLKTVPPNAGGDVQVLSDGQLRIDVRNLPLTTGFHEVWLLDPDNPGKMVAIGNLSDKTEALLPVPPGTDLNRFRLVDVSDEPHDGDATHSGLSLLRGTLTS